MKIFLYLILFFISKFSYGEEIKILDYIKNINTFQAKFVEKVQDETKTGQIYIKKDGKVSIIYDKNSGNLHIVATKNNIKYYDKKIEQLTNMNNKYGELFSLLTMNIKKDQITQLNDYLCTNLPQDTIDHGSKNNIEACLKIDHHDNQYKIKSLISRNKDNNTILSIMEFNDIVINEEIKSDIFEIKDPRIFKDEF